MHFQLLGDKSIEIRVHDREALVNTWHMHHIKVIEEIHNTGNARISVHYLSLSYGLKLCTYTVCMKVPI